MYYMYTCLVVSVIAKSSQILVEEKYNFEGLTLDQNLD